MNKFEEQGLKWLIDAVEAGRIAISSADKGGAIVTTYPAKIMSMTADKLNDESQFRKVTDPCFLEKVRSEMFSFWKQGLENGIVSKFQAKKVVGLLVDSKGKYTLSTNDLFKPGATYGYPLLKIHKISQ